LTTFSKLSNLQGRRALITGGAGHLGRVFADTLGELGADLLLVDLPGSNLEDFSREVRTRWDVNVSSYFCDLESQVQRAELIQRVIDSEMPLNILVNNAAFVGTSNLSGWSVPFEVQSLETWRRAIEVNLTGVFDLCKGLTPILRRSGNSSIVNIASIYGFLGPDWDLYKGTNMSNPAAYAASKAGLIQFTRWLSTTVSPEIRVNSISPGGVFRSQPEVFVERYIEKTPLGRMAEEDDFRGAIAYLASDMSRYVTGHNLVIDGGREVL
jgi:NAD(P)-dependent dehydrogenase (short-subunit alcohol dehydrogenase family)